MVGLHHGGLHRNDNVKQLTSSLVPLLSSDSNRKKYRTFKFVPQSPEGKGFGRAPSSFSIDSLVFEAIIDFEKEFNINKTRRYVLGALGGGYGTWNFISSRPEMFAAAIPISGGGDPKFASSLTNVAIWVFHGAKDKDVPVNLSRDMIEAIKKADGNPKYTEYPNKGHIIGNEVENTQGLLDWLFQQKRED
jgi:predicted peptidase